MSSHKQLEAVSESHSPDFHGGETEMREMPSGAAGGRGNPWLQEY